jgi:iron complex outermembrane receptor protein
VRLLEKKLEFKPSASKLLGVAQAGNDVSSQALLTSSLDLGPNITVDTTLRYVDSLPSPHLDSYLELSAAIGWHAWERLDLALTGANLLDSRHLEYPTTNGEYIRRSVMLQGRWRF